MFSYARASLLHYTRWMAQQECPYLSRPEILEHPTETWVAQDMRKSEVFQWAAMHADGAERAAFLEQAEFFFRYSVDTLLAMPSRRFVAGSEGKSVSRRTRPPHLRTSSAAFSSRRPILLRGPRALWCSRANTTYRWDGFTISIAPWRNCAALVGSAATRATSFKVSAPWYTEDKSAPLDIKAT